MFVASTSNGEFVPGLLVFDYGELAKKHLVGAKASIFPRVEVHQNMLAESKLRVTVDDAEPVAHLAAEFFDHNLSFGDLSLEDFLNLQLYVGEYASLLLVESAFNGEYSSFDDYARPNDHIVVRRNDGGCCKAGLGTAEEKD